MDQVEEIKSKVDIVGLIGEYITLKKAGRNFKANCPFHGEKTPSFMVNPELQIFKCFGCGAGGDAYEFLKRMEGMEFGEALAHLAERVGVTLKTYAPSAFEKKKERLLEINNKAADYYHYLLTKHKLGEAAMKYLEGRGITDESIEKFKLGFAPEGWDFLSKYLVGKKGYAMDELIKTGLVVEGKTYDRFRNRVMFPLNNARGQTLGFAGRVLPPLRQAFAGQASADVQQAKYVNTPETEVYHKGDLLYGLDVNRAEIKTSGWVVVVEGEIDAIASWQAGVRNVVAIKGSALTEKQVELLRRIAETVVLGLDSDAAGEAASKRGIEIAQRQGLAIKIVDAESEQINPNKYKDPGDWAIQEPDSWLSAVKLAVPIYDFYLESAVRKHGLDGIGKTKIGKELLPIWARIDDEIMRAHYVKLLADKLGVDEGDVRGQLAKHQAQSAKAPDFARASSGKQILVENKTSGGRREVLEKYLVGLGVRNGWGVRLKEVEKQGMIRGDFWRRVIQQWEGSGREATKRLPAELREKVESLFLEEEEKDPEKEWNRACNLLEGMGIRERIEKIKTEIEGKKAGEEMRRLTERLSELTKVE